MRNRQVQTTCFKSLIKTIIYTVTVTTFFTKAENKFYEKMYYSQ